jgi:hypothetical protein
VAQLIIDTSGYLAGTAGAHPLHDTVLKLLGSVRQPPVVSPMVMAEIDYMVLDKVGAARELDVIRRSDQRRDFDALRAASTRVVMGVGEKPARR